MSTSHLARPQQQNTHPYPPSSSFQILEPSLAVRESTASGCTAPPFSSIPCAIYDSSDPPPAGVPFFCIKRIPSFIVHSLRSCSMQSCHSWNTSLEWVGAAMASAPATHSRDAGDDPYNDKVMLAAIISLSIVIFFVFFLHIYARWLIRRRQRPVVRRVVVFREPLHLRSIATFPGHTTEIRLSISGVDPKVVASLPVFVYKSREHEHGLECVVCLSAMEEDDSGRLLPACKHAFHVGCIDVWLMSHATCPICRAPVEIMGDPAQVVDAVSVAVPVAVAVECEAAVQVEPRNANEESCVVNVAAAEEGGVGVDISSLGPATATHTIKEDSSSSPSSPSSPSFGSSLKRMLSRGRS